MDLAVWDLSPRRHKMVDQATLLVWQFMSEILARLHLTLISREGCGLLNFSVLRMKQRFGILLNPCLLGYFVWLNSIFHLLFPPRELLLYHYSPHRVVSVHIPAQQMKVQLLRTATTQPPCPLCLPGVLGTKTTSCLRWSFLHLCPPLPSTVFGWISWPCTFCSPWRPIQMQVADLHAIIISRQFCLLLTWSSNTERNKSTATMQKQRVTTLHQVCLCTPLCWEKAFVIRSALLQEYSVAIKATSAMSADRSPPYSRHVSQPVHWSLSKVSWIRLF